MVKINEFHNHDIEQEMELPALDYNVGEDLLIFMRNDPMFYRKTFFPAVDQFKKKKDKAVLMPVIKKGLNTYCDKYNIPHDRNKLLGKGDIDEIIRSIINDEVNNGS